MIRQVQRTRAFVRGCRQTRKRHAQAMAHFRQFVAPGALVFDIGANRGDRTAVFRRLGGTVISVEPSHEMAAQLAMRFRNDPHVTIVEKAVAASVGTVTLHINTISELNSVSPDWIEAMDRSGRFTEWGSRWVEERTVASTTLDELTSEFGRPSFCKIDVEGFEAEVLMGLTSSIASLGLEFVSERPERTLRCVELLQARGMGSFNISYGGSFRMEFPDWLMGSSVEELLSAASVAGAWGDVYARKVP